MMQNSDKDIPLVVDLDGTLLKTDLLYEAILLLFRKNPLYIFACLLWIIKGKVNFKNEVFKIVHLRYELLPFNKELLNYLQNESAKGRKLILATASLKSSAIEVAKIYPIFNEIYGTEEVNLKGVNKLNYLVNKFGESKFDYIGNSAADLKIFGSSRYSYLVNPTRSLERKTKKILNHKYSWKSGNLNLLEYIKAIRAYQWIKNLLIFVPLITSHTFYDFNKVAFAVIGFLSFCLVASSGYIINDLFDLNSDRSHPRKQFRPFASGSLSILSGVILIFILFSAGLLIASQLGIPFIIILFVYFTISFSYSLYFKKIVLHDVFLLSMLYSIRVIAGAIAISVSISFWLIAFSTFIFLSLAFVKRYSELMKIGDETSLRERGREYSRGDLGLLQILGVVSGYLSIVVFSLYIISPEVTVLYANPRILGGISFLFLYWISHIWFKTNRGEMTDDPIVFATKDLSSYIIVLMIGLIIWISI